MQERKYSIYGIKCIEKFAKKYNFPYWWVESVFVEYFPCRRFFVDGELWTFDFNLVPKNLIENITEYNVVIPGYFIAQNIRPKDLGRRTVLGSIGSPITPLSKEIIYPEGKLNNTAFPFLGNPIYEWDHKLNLHSHAIVLDNGDLYQWKIAELVSPYEKNHSWYKSDLFDSRSLFDVYMKLNQLRTQDNFRKPTDQLRQTARKIYDELENVRKPIRKKIWEYHQIQKSKHSNSTSSFLTPPTVTEFDSIILDNGTYKVRTNLEPLLFRSAIRNYNLAKQVNESFNQSKDANQRLQEVEYSLMTIVAVTGCLESYINMIIMEHAQKYKNLKEHSKKWKLVGKFLHNGNEIFKDEVEPFKSFITIKDLRDDAMHYELGYLDPIDEKGQIYSKFNHTNAKLAILTVKPMIRKLCENTKLVMPLWLGPIGGSGGYWDETFHNLDFEL